MFPKRRSALLSMLAVLALLATQCTPPPEPAETGFPKLSGPYLGQEPPGAEPVLFAPGIVSNGLLNRDIAITPDGKEVYFCNVVGQYTMSAIMVTREIDGFWTEPEVAPFSGTYMDLEPCISADGSKFFFLSNRPASGEGPPEESSEDIWVMEREGDGWGEPYNLGAPINTEVGEYFPSVTSDGTLYYTNQPSRSSATIYRSRLVDGVYSTPDELGPEVNSGAMQFNAFVAPDESYIIVCVVGRADSIGSTDYYISYRDENDVWTGPFNLGDKINTPGGMEFSPYVSPDGKYFFFMSTRSEYADGYSGKKHTMADLFELAKSPGNGFADIYWIEASFIEELRPR